MKLVLATNNKNKIREIKNKLKGVPGIELIPLSRFDNPPDVVEDGSSFRENALKKAREISEFTGMNVMADDSGLVVDALDGRPGIMSARYGGAGSTDADRNRIILKEMDGIPAAERSARFVCVIAIVLSDESYHFTDGICKGFIAEEMKGTMGFGYDPIFYIPELDKTMAEIPLEEKNRISHRALALDNARELLLKINKK